MKFWTMNLVTLFVSSICVTPEAKELGSYHPGNHLDSHENNDVLRLFDLDTMVQTSQEVERFLGIGGSLSMSLAPSVRAISKEGKSKEGKSKDGKSKNGKSKDGKSKDGKKSKSNKERKGKGKSGMPPDGKEGKKKTKGGEGKIVEKIVVTKNEKRHRVLGIGYSEPESSGKDVKKTKAKSGKAKSGKKEKMESYKDNEKLSLPSSSKGTKPDGIPPNVKITSTPTASSKGKSKSGAKGNSKVGKSSDTSKSKAGSKSDSKGSVSDNSTTKHGSKTGSKAGAKGKINSTRLRVRRRAQVTEDLATWKSNRRELGDHCLIGPPSGVTSNPAIHSRGKEGAKSGSKDGSKSGSKEGSKSGSKGVERRDRGRRRTEIGLYACNMSGSWTCCKEYADMGDDPVCCKGDYTDSVAAREEPLGHKPDDNKNKSNSKSNSKGSSTDAKKNEISTSRGPSDVQPSYSNDVPLAVNSPGFGGPPLTRTQQRDPAIMRVEHGWHNNGKN